MFGPPGLHEGKFSLLDDFSDAVLDVGVVMVFDDIFPSDGEGFGG